MGEVVRPRAVTYSATCQEWFSQGARASRILPMIWVHNCNVAQVSRHAAVGGSGHEACEALLMLEPDVPGAVVTRASFGRQSRSSGRQWSCRNAAGWR